ncbi:hypothetical protein [Pseudonocardia sp. WMMC193]|nr:hypothetical protein [Pseudonocardia sp. WMMC193]MCF7550489.1 hypothetical protein [Pseudonocardia sp. WMMC193]
MTEEVERWIEDQLAQPWPLAPEQLDTLCRALAQPSTARPIDDDRAAA